MTGNPYIVTKDSLFNKHTLSRYSNNIINKTFCLRYTPLELGTVGAEQRAGTLVFPLVNASSVAFCAEEQINLPSKDSLVLSIQLSFALYHSPLNFRIKHCVQSG
uniref:Uncharacterized protein n=1 Tax=Anguilla anguilla TaxID=7936 RepID=A0A0E9X7W6_ANGAN